MPKVTTLEKGGVGAAVEGEAARVLLEPTASWEFTLAKAGLKGIFLVIVF